MKNNWIVVLSIAVTVVFLLWLAIAASFVAGGQGKAIAEFGSATELLSALFSAAAFIAVVYTLNLQRTELREQRAQFESMAESQASALRLSREQHKIDADVRCKVHPLLNDRLLFNVQLVSDSPRANVIGAIILDQGMITPHTDIQTVREGEGVYFESPLLENDAAHRIRLFYQSAVGEYRELGIVAHYYAGEDLVAVTKTDDAIDPRAWADAFEEVDYNWLGVMQLLPLQWARAHREYNNVFVT